MFSATAVVVVVVREVDAVACPNKIVHTVRDCRPGAHDTD